MSVNCWFSWYGTLWVRIVQSNVTAESDWLCCINDQRALDTDPVERRVKTAKFCARKSR